MGEFAGSRRRFPPDQPSLAERYAAYSATARLQIIERCFRRKLHLFAKAFGDDGDIDELKQLMGIGTHRAAVKRCQYAPARHSLA